MQAAAAVFGLGLLIFVHELGHLVVGSLCGLKIEEFAIGFWKPLFSFKWLGIQWSLRIIPLGGFVRYAEAPEDTAEKGRYFNTAPPRAVAMVAAAGPSTSYLFAVLLFFAVNITYGRWEGVLEINRVRADSPAAIAGLQSEDRIEAIDGHALSTLAELQQSLAEGAPDQTRQLMVVRNGTTVEVSVIPKDGALGLEMRGRHRDMALPESTYNAVQSANEYFVQQLKGMWALVTRVIPASELGGVISIGKMIGDGAEHGMAPYLWILGILSAVFAALNFLPIAYLDGGHVIRALLHMVAGRPINPRVWSVVEGVSLALLLWLMAFSNGMDISRLFG